MADNIENFGLSTQTISEIRHNPILLNNFQQIIHGIDPIDIDKSKAYLFFKLAGEYPVELNHNRPILIRFILDGSLNKNNIELAIEYMKSQGEHELNDLANLKKICGIGEEYSDRDIRNIVTEEVEKGGPKGAVITRIKLKYPNLDPQSYIHLIPNKIEKKYIAEERRFNLPTPETNYQLEPIILERHLEATGGRVITRFPPEPSGHLHIGHALMINMNFRYASENNGYCILRYDDTNPETATQGYCDSILNDIEWLGFRPYRISRTSDYFDVLYDYALTLIDRGLAYVCHQNNEDMKTYRLERRDSPYRLRSIEENRSEFSRMVNGEYDEGKAILRLKIDMKSDNAIMRDPVAYRVRKVNHYATGDRWKIYPSYDFSHCIVDSLENVTNSICSSEFEVRKEVYNWILDNLRIYRPRQLEFKRLKIINGVTSKRMIRSMIDENRANGWDDPRLLTIKGLRNRGFTSTALNRFCMSMGLSKNCAAEIEFEILENFQREEFELSAERIFAVFDPLQVNISNKNEVVFIDRKDFRLKSTNEDYYGLVPNGMIRLKHYGLIQYQNHLMIGDQVTSVDVIINEESELKIKGVVQYVREFEEYDIIQYGLIENKNTDSMSIKESKILIDNKIRTSTVGDIWQFERHGYYVHKRINDKDVFCEIVSIKNRRK